LKIYKIITSEASAQLCEVIKGGDWQEGKARTKALTGTIKQNLELHGKPDTPIGKIADTLGKTILAHSTVQLDNLPLTANVPKFNKYMNGGHYKRHTDAPWMMSVRTDLACTMWLTEPDTYDGGELCVNGQKVKGKAGEALIYRCGSPHEVTPVTRGERICAITWIQSRVRDEYKRQIVTDLRKFLQNFDDTSDLLVQGSAVHSALLRMWME